MDSSMESTKGDGDDVEQDSFDKKTELQRNASCFHYGPSGTSDTDSMAR